MKNNANNNMNNINPMNNNMNNQMNMQMLNPNENQMFNPMNQMGVPQMNNFNFMNQMPNMNMNMNMMNQMNNPMPNQMILNPMFPQMNINNNSMLGMGNQNNTMNQLVPMGTEREEENDNLIIIFRIEHENCHIMVQCQSNDKMIDAIYKFRNKSLLNINDYKFIFNEKEVQTDKTIKENGITNNSNISVVKASLIGNSDNNNKNLININQNNSQPQHNSSKKINIHFQIHSSGTLITVVADFNDTLEDVAKEFCSKNGAPVKALKNLIFLYNGAKLDINDKRVIGQIFDFRGGVFTIAVIDLANIIGA